MPQPLVASQGRLDGHFQKINDIVASLPEVPAPRLEVNWDLSRILASFDGAGCEFIVRNRGGRTPVSPLLHLHDGLWAWLGFAEEWDEEDDSRPTNRKFVFREIGLTVHFGWKNDAFKPQIFRAEWPGWLKWNGEDFSFQAGNAGHPHWQFDALESLQPEPERVSILRAVLAEESQAVVRDFSPRMTEDDVIDLVRSQQLSRVHFASAAAWWKKDSDGGHAHSPSALLDLESWLTATLSYIVDELARLSA